MSFPSPRIRGAILSDDVRTEINGKNIIIGTYGPEIGVEKFPVQLRFRLTLLLDFEGASSYQIKIRVVGPSGDELGNFESEIELDRPGLNVLLPTIGFSVPFSSPGSISIDSFRDENWEQVGEWSVVRVDPSEFPSQQR